MISAEPKKQRVISVKVRWAQWDAAHQRLYVIHGSASRPIKPQMLVGYSFTSDGHHEMFVSASNLVL